MLTQINIHHFTIIEELTVNLAPGMTVLTGETGAGKSILIDALNLTLGDRADVKLIRENCDKASIAATFNIKNNLAAKQWLNEHDYPVSEDCLLRRVISRKGQSSAYINGISCTVLQLKQLADLLISIHGQHEHHSLLHKEAQRQLLDDFANNATLLAKMKQHYQQLKSKQNLLAQLQDPHHTHHDKMALLKYQIAELDELNLAENELDELFAEQKKLNSAESVIITSQSIKQQLSDDELAIDNLLHRAIAQLNQFRLADETIANIIQLLQSAQLQVSEAADELERLAENYQADPERLQWLEKRLSTIHDLARKHHVNAKDLFSFHQQLMAQYQQLLANADTVKNLTNEIETLNQHCHNIAQQLNKVRTTAAKKLSKLVSEQINSLGMQGGQLHITVTANDQQFSQYGADHVEFLVKTNPGQAFHPLNKIASGGELSRISLAIDVICAKIYTVPTIIFDEVDTGIGGGIAEIVGQLIQQLSLDCQVLCITHLPQIAVKAQHHFRISKSAHNNSTQTTARVLNEVQRIDEIARMLGGIEITTQTKAHAKEMLGFA